MKWAMVKEKPLPGTMMVPVGRSGGSPHYLQDNAGIQENLTILCDASLGDTEINPRLGLHITADNSSPT